MIMIIMITGDDALCIISSSCHCCCCSLPSSDARVLYSRRLHLYQAALSSPARYRSFINGAAAVVLAPAVVSLTPFHFFVTSHFLVLITFSHFCNGSGSSSCCLPVCLSELLSNLTRADQTQVNDTDVVAGMTEMMCQVYVLCVLLLLLLLLLLS